MIGGNFRLHELQAAFLRVKLRHLDPALKKRRENAVRLIRQLQEKWNAVFPAERCVCEGESKNLVQRSSGDVLLPFVCQEKSEHTWNQFVIRLVGEGKRDGWRQKLAKEGIQSEIYYPRSMHEQACFTDGKTDRFPAAEAFAKEVLALPLALFL